MKTKIAIVGRPNVGKSTLFNRICKRKLAIVADQPGITRDRKEYAVALSNIDLIIVDTAGLIISKCTTNLESHIIDQTRAAIAQASVIIFILDAKENITSLDLDIANELRKANKPIILALNKSENKATAIEISETFSLGFGDPLCISGMHGLGMDDLYKRIVIELKKQHISVNKNNIKETEITKKSQSVIAIVGRPNVGKSTFFNALISQNRSIVSEEAGTTIDAITAILEHSSESDVQKGNEERSHMESNLLTYDNAKNTNNTSNIDIALIDTAGMRKRNKINANSIENMAVGQSITAVRRANLVILIIEATQPFQKQDLAIAHMIMNEGKALIIILNKCDLVENIKDLKKEITLSITNLIPDFVNPPILYLSAIQGINNTKFINMMNDVLSKWEIKIKTSDLNKWLHNALISHSPPSSRRKARLKFPKIKYITQVADRPPTFKLFTNTPDDFSYTYIKYLRTSLVKEFGLYGIPVRLLLQKKSNPYICSPLVDLFSIYMYNNIGILCGQ